MTMTPREILQSKVFLNVKDIMVLNDVGENKAYQIIKQINDTKALKGQCSVDSYIRHFDIKV